MKKYLYKNEKTGQYTYSNKMDWGLVQSGYILLSDEEKKEYEERKRVEDKAEGHQSTE